MPFCQFDCSTYSGFFFFSTRWAWGDESAISQPDLTCVDWIRQSRKIIKNRKALQNCLLLNWRKWDAATSMSLLALLDVSAGLYQLTPLPPSAGARFLLFPLMFLQIWLITSPKTVASDRAPRSHSFVCFFHGSNMILPCQVGFMALTQPRMRCLIGLAQNISHSESTCDVVCLIAFTKPSYRAGLWNII